MWHVKHRPASLDGFMGKSAVEQARKWDGAPVIVYGATGTGKTLLSRLIAAERGWDVIDVSGENLGEAESIANTGSLYGNKKMLLIEDVDSLRDIKAIGGLVDNTCNPIVLTTRDYGSRRLSTLKKKCGKLQLRRPIPASIVKHLRGICEAEGVEVDKQVLDGIAKNAGGDVRAAVTDLETVATGRESVGAGDVDVLPDRDRDSDIYRALSVIFGGKVFRDVVACTWDLSEQPRDVLWWVEENTPRLYQDRQAIQDSYSSLSRADVFLGRILRRQYWGFLRYANVLMTAGVNACRPEKVNYARYMFPGYFAAMGRSRGGRNMEDSIVAKMGPPLHVSGRVVKREYIPLYRFLLKRKCVEPEMLKRRYDLDDEDMDYLSG